MSQQLVLALASTIRHDGNGGVADDLADVAGLAAWLREQAEPLREYAAEPFAGTPDEHLRRDVVAVRRAVRALFAHAVRPGPPSRADSSTLMPVPDAVERLNEDAGRLPVRPVLSWPDGSTPTIAWRGAATDARRWLVAVLARAAIEFLTGPARTHLLACPAPRCVRYFVKDHPRQAWCKPSCGNRARVSRHYQRHAASPTVP
ncbi:MULTISPECIES: ABATE domain-containing protein [unclassified Micromonospora]|uniref:CGNR zinc finger domain-containing protein n=1 Tax=unclassified Micromonospora TaxID=2617518 RepID=UPI00103474CF|nr:MULTISPECIES: CGNR zinc finger domain-containing protein [unclassified Micromonospora]QKW13325.1 CGNR zinc finger domain-containing protein [Verrucosispora sp. NA02020]TBL28936.1 CGNR zinc finger domain-containing protein [Verrucosispora sp. SN26_14.1]